MNSGSFGRYRIEGLLGQGGMGRVYRAFDTHLRRPVALKVLPAEEDGSEPRERVARIVAEARAAAAIEHPNVVTIYDAGEEGGQPYVAMQLLEGLSLRAFVGRTDPGVPTRLAWLVEIALALSAAHRLGIIHRDIKPENVLVCAGGVKVLDFGVAKRAPGAIASRPLSAPNPSMPVSLPGAVIGTPSYMAPEQRRGMPIDARVDQYAWGVVGYELLVGTLPSDPPQIIQAAAPWVAPEIAMVIDRALAQDPGMRFASIDALLRALPRNIAPASVAQPTAPEGPAPPPAAAPPTLSARPWVPPPASPPLAPLPSPPRMPSSLAPNVNDGGTRRSPGQTPDRSGTSTALVLLAVTGGLFGVAGLGTAGWYWNSLRLAELAPDAAAPVIVTPTPAPSSPPVATPSSSHATRHDAGTPRAPDGSAPAGRDHVIYISVTTASYPPGSQDGFFNGLKGAFDGCLRQAHPPSQRSVNLSLALDQEGKVMSVNSPQFPVAKCMAGIVSELVLPPPPGGGGGMVLLAVEFGPTGG